MVIDKQLGLTGAKPCAPEVSRRRVNVPMVGNFIILICGGERLLIFVL